MTRPFLRTLCLILAAALPLQAAASYARHEAALRFVQEMEQTHGFDAAQLLDALSHISHDERVIRLITPPTKPGTRSWQRYRARFVEERRIEGGVDFWDSNAATVEAASARYGVPAEIIVAIVGVETHYGRHTGNFETASALATLAFDYPPRAELFRRELEHLFLLAREQRRDPLSYTGSYAGALGYAQFLPSSIRDYAVDFDGDGQVDLENSPADAIGSIANYLARHGWRAGEPIAVPVRLPADLDPKPMIDAGIEPALAPERVMAAGIKPLQGRLYADAATLVDLETPAVPTEYWLGYRNFYVITRYNRSSFYAMSVFELAEAIRTRRDGAPR